MITMTENHTEPRAWIGSLAAYNAGRLVGAWIDLDGLDEEDATEAAREAMRPQIAGWMDEAQAFDELHVFDHEGLSPLVAGECSVSEATNAAEVLSGLDESEAEAFRAYVAYQGAAYADVDDFRDAYAGQWDSLEAYAEDYLESSGTLNEIPENLRAYFDVQAFARDMRIGGDVWTVDAGAPDYGVYVFHG